MHTQYTCFIKECPEMVGRFGEFYNKRMLAITFTPHFPRGEKAMQSLIWSLQALNAKIIGQLPLYADGIELEKNQIELSSEVRELIQETLNALL